jgi:hypothetical protein
VAFQDLLPELASITGLPEWPDPKRSYPGRSLTWQWYELESELKDQGLPELPGGARYRIDMALAEPEGGFCTVAIITVPGDWEEHSTFYENLFTHALYNTVALPWSTPPDAEGGSNG